MLSYENFSIENYSFQITKDIDEFGKRKSGPPTILLTIDIPFTTVKPEDIKDWMTQGKLMKDMDLLTYKKGKVDLHYRFFDAHCSQYHDFYNDKTSKMVMSFSVHPKHMKVESIMSSKR